MKLLRINSGSPKMLPVRPWIINSCFMRLRAVRQLRFGSLLLVLFCLLPVNVHAKTGSYSHSLIQHQIVFSGFNYVELGWEVISEIKASSDARLITDSIRVNQEKETPAKVTMRRAVALLCLALIILMAALRTVIARSIKGS